MPQLRAPRLPAAIRTRRFRYVLALARRWYAEDLEDLTGRDLDMDARQKLLRALRSWNVRLAARHVPGMQVMTYGLLVFCCAVCLLAPVAIVGALVGYPRDASAQVLAGATYLALFGTVCAGFFGMQTLPPARGALVLASALGVVSAVAAALITALWLAPVHGVWAAIRFGIECGAAALAVVMVLRGPVFTAL